MLKNPCFYAYWALFCIELRRVLDPCMGSGHILVYAFDVLMFGEWNDYGRLPDD